MSRRRRRLISKTFKDYNHSKILLKRNSPEKSTIRVIFPNLTKTNFMILVTGSSGHIGNVLVRQLVEQGKAVRILTKDGKKPEWLAHLELDVVQGDLNDEAAVHKAVEGTEVVFHLAGIISISSFDSKELTEINVKGTEHVVNACLAHGVRRMVYTSSVHALPEGKKGVAITEDRDFD